MILSGGKAWPSALLGKMPQISSFALETEFLLKTVTGFAALSTISSHGCGWRN
jgi:hypothetical protein